MKTALTDRELESFGTPDPRILVCGCGGSGNNTMNRITHIGVEGAITVAINTDKQDLDLTRAMQKLLVDGPLDGWAACSHVTSFGDAARLRDIELFVQLGS